MRTAAIVPFKCFTRAKRRLRVHYSDEQVERLGRAMLGDVLEALSRTSTLDRVTVLTDDEAVADVARDAGAAVRLEAPDPGLNPAIDAAEQDLLASKLDASLVVLGDLPLLQPPDVEKVVLAGQEHSLVIVPSTDGGTALLLRRPPACISSHFGPNSTALHIAAAEAAGLKPLVMTELGEEVALDLDTPEDARQVLSSPRPSRTRELLREFAG